MKIEIEKINDNAGLYRATKLSAGYDVMNIENRIIKPGCSCVIDFGFKMKLPDNYFAMISSRSSAYLMGLDVYRGIIDSDFYDVPLVFYFNRSNKDIELKVGKRYVQIILMKYKTCEFTEVTNILKTIEHKGFGSTN